MLKQAAMNIVIYTVRELVVETVTFYYFMIYKLFYYQSIFEQVWAGEDFELFKSMMVKKNLDLELQALYMIQQRNGVAADVFKSGKLLK